CRLPSICSIHWRTYPPPIKTACAPTCHSWLTSLVITKNNPAAQKENTMSYSTVKDVLDYSRKLHEHTRNLYQQLRDHTQREREDMMLTLLAAHENTLADAMASMQEHTSQKVLQEWHQFEPGSISEALQDARELHPDISVDELVKVALRIDDYLISLYRQILSETTSDLARAVFERMIRLEEAEKMRTVRAALSANDW